MQFQPREELLPALGGPDFRVTALAWSPNGMRLAVASAHEKLVHLFNDRGERKDKFPTKPSFADDVREYSVTALTFSPDSSKCAVAQSDGGIFVYKLGLDWGEKKVICNKFLLGADIAITCMVWPQNSLLVYGASDGRVRAGIIKSNKAAVIFESATAPVVSMAQSEDRSVVVVGMLDGGVHRCICPADSADIVYQGRVLQHSCPPYALAVCGAQGGIVAAGNDLMVSFYDAEGKSIQKFDYIKDDAQHEFVSVSAAPETGHTVSIGSYDRIHVFNYNSRSASWKEGPVLNIERFYTVTALAWSPDGSRIAAGSLFGCAELLECSLRKIRYRGTFEFTYVSPCQVLVRRLSDGHQMTLKSSFGGDVTNINVVKDRYITAFTADTLLVGDMVTSKASEVPWTGGGQEKFNFDYANICAVFNAGELSIIEFGSDRMLGSCRTEHSSPNLISVRVNERKSPAATKAIAYLSDAQTIHVMNLDNSTIISTIKHDATIRWLQLSGKGNKLLYRDKRQHLFLHDIQQRKSTTLLPYCSFVAWVADSDVAVAQNGSTMSVWYNMNTPERVTNTAIKGDIVKLDKVDARTVVVVDHGISTQTIPLDEKYIEFGTSIEDHDYNRAMDLLEALDMNPEVESMWKSLGDLAMEDRKTYIAEVCYAAVGDVATVLFLKNINKMVRKVATENSMLPDPMDHYSVRAKLAIFHGHFKLAETIYLEQGRVEEAMEMYQQMHKWDQSISVAEARNHPELKTLKQNYFQWLLDSGQEEHAAKIKEDSGDYAGAINLYLTGGLPGRAAQVLQNHSTIGSKIDVVERVAKALCDSDLYEKAGDLYAKLQQWPKAFACYKKGHAYQSAIQLARSYFPNEVTTLETEWAQHLVGERQFEAAVNHYIEAGKVQRAIEVAASAKLWRKVTSIVESMGDAALAQPYHDQLAQHYDETNDCEQAEKFYTLAGNVDGAVEIYLKRNRWDDAYRVASSLLPPEQVQEMLAKRAKLMETQGNLEEAERLYLAAGLVDDAIDMYKTFKHYNHMTRLVATYHKDLLQDTHIFIAKILESERRFKEAEFHFCEAMDWKGAIGMYCSNNLYEEAYRVAKAFGGVNASKQIAYVWAKHLGGDAAVKLLSKFRLLEVAVDFAVESKQFEFAFELAKAADDKKLLLTVYYKQALEFEDQGKFKEAELAFIQAEKAKEAVLMYISEEQWDAAFQVAETHDPSCVEDVLIGQASAAFQQKNYVKAETLVLRAQRSDFMLKLYRDAGMWKEALQFTKEYLPAKLSEVHAEYDRFLVSQAGSGVEELMATARSLERDREYSKAIDMYLRVNTDISTSVTELESAWTKAVQLAYKYCIDRSREVLLKVADRFMKLGKYEEAAKLLAEAKEYKEAVGAYIAGDMWSQARQIAANDSQLLSHVEASYVNYLKKKGQADALVNVDLAAALDMFAQRGEWDRCLQQAFTSGDQQLLNKYLIAYSTELAAQGKVELAAQKLAEFGAPAIPANFEFYDSVIKKIFWDGGLQSVSAARDFLFKLIAQGSSAVPPRYEEYLFIAHLYSLREYCANKRELAILAAKQSIALLRYSSMLKADRTFYRAGSLAKTSGMTNMAFVCWNRYLDLSDAIEDGTKDAVLNDGDFAGSDMPASVNLPPDNLPEREREDARDWILSMSLDKQTRQDADKRKCDNCQSIIFGPSLCCFQCSKTWTGCCVTGYPVLNAVQCSSCKKQANKDDWNKFVVTEQTCPWCGSAQSPNFSS